MSPWHFKGAKPSNLKINTAFSNNYQSSDFCQTLRKLRFLVCFWQPLWGENRIFCEKTFTQTKDKLGKHYGDSSSSTSMVKKLLTGIRWGRTGTNVVERSKRLLKVATPETIGEIHDNDNDHIAQWFQFRVITEYKKAIPRMGSAFGLNWPLACDNLKGVFGIIRLQSGRAFAPIHNWG